jgi:hypothetical protein
MSPVEEDFGLGDERRTDVFSPFGTALFTDAAVSVGSFRGACAASALVTARPPRKATANGRNMR